MAERSKILIIGGTGSIGKYILEASAKLGHPTFALIRETTASNPLKAKLMDNFKTLGVTLLRGDLNDHESLVMAIRLVDVVISAVGYHQVADQVKIIDAIKDAGNVKRFLPSEFGADPDHVQTVEPAASFFAIKANIRRAIEAAGISYTYVVSNGFAGYVVPSLGQPNSKVPPRDKVVILGDGNPKVILVKEEDIATYTIKSVDDPRTLNKCLHIRPPANILSFNEIVALWEKKIGKTLEKTYILKDELLKQIQEVSPPMKFRLSISYHAAVNGDSLLFEIQPSVGVEASELYPEVKYSTVDEYLDQFV